MDDKTHLWRGVGVRSLRLRASSTAAGRTRAGSCAENRGSELWIAGEEEYNGAAKISVLPPHLFISTTEKARGAGKTQELSLSPLLSDFVWSLREETRRRAASGEHGPWAVAYNPWAIAHDFLLFGYKAQYGMANIVIAVTALEVFKLPLQSVPVLLQCYCLDGCPRL